MFLMESLYGHKTMAELIDGLTIEIELIEGGSNG